MELVAREVEGNDYHKIDESFRRLRALCGVIPTGGLVQISREKADREHYNECSSCFGGNDEQ